MYNSCVTNYQASGANFREISGAENAGRQNLPSSGAVVEVHVSVSKAKQKRLEIHGPQAVDDSDTRAFFSPSTAAFRGDPLRRSSK